ncbi:response regulator transcription factor [Chitinophaga sp. GbtcB8]|jgi:DNA-binding NarL/FixJ family response regulator|uniref:response regulator transcription factor n=1 Tax=Chitinophaga sp. GbtcB8 TaxID=2824753 RepID=UPI001C30B77A|nr:response regulator transcription factor [Chitinophaga sp. GbtcB8]
MYNTIRLAIACDHTIIRKAISDLLSRSQELKVIIDVSNTAELLKNLDSNDTPDVLLFAPSVYEKESLSQIRYHHPHIKVIVMLMQFEPYMANDLLELGIHGYLSKRADTTELLQAINAAAVGMVYQNKTLTDTLNWRANHPLPSHAIQQQLIFTENQKKILQLLWREKSTKEIANEVFLSTSAVDKIKQQLKEATGTKTTLGLIKYAIEQKIILL